MESLKITYHLAASPADPHDRVAEILLEQTVETPTSVATRYPFVRDHMMGVVQEVRPHTGEGHLVTLALPTATAASDPAQFLNVLFGNSSLHDDVRLEDFELPPSVRALFNGPRYGLEGLRRITGVHDRPLTCSALKPSGLTPEELASLCRAFTAGGIDLIKDDHYLADQSFAPFEARVDACLDAVAKAASEFGRDALYVPNLSGTPETIRRQAEYAQNAGARAVMIAPMLIGLPFLHELTTHYLDVPLLAHPSFSGAMRIRPSTLFGKLFRLYGADAAIFANFGGRFSYSPGVCREIADTLRSDWHGLNSAFPVPAGGMDANRAAELVHFFGPDTILLVGGSLLEAGSELTDKTAAFTEEVARAATALSDKGNLGAEGSIRPALG